MAQDTPNDATLVTVGQVLRPHGTSGEIRVRTYSDVPHRFDPGSTVIVADTPYRIISASNLSPELLLLKLAGVDTEAAAQRLRGAWVQSPASDSPLLPDGEYFHYQLIGLRVVTEDGEELGKVTQILETGSNDVYIVAKEGAELLLPAISDVIMEVRLDRGEMVVRMLEGLR